MNYEDYTQDERKLLDKFAGDYLAGVATTGVSYMDADHEAGKAYAFAVAMLKKRKEIMYGKT